MATTTVAHATQQGLQNAATMQLHVAQEPPQQPAKRGKPAGAYLLISYCSQFAEGLGLADISLPPPFVSHQEAHPHTNRETKGAEQEQPACFQAAT